MSNLKFSDKLITQIISYFQDHYGIKISNVQAEEFLDSLAELYLAFWNIEQNKKKNQSTTNKESNSPKYV